MEPPGGARDQDGQRQHELHHGDQSDVPAGQNQRLDRFRVDHPAEKLPDSLVTDLLRLEAKGALEEPALEQAARGGGEAGEKPVLGDAKRGGAEQQECPDQRQVLVEPSL